jgi:hypothetical protein
MVFNLIKALKNKAEYIYQVGIDPFNFSFKFDSFFISTEAIVFLSILFILITLTTFTLGRVIAEEKTRPSHLFYFLTMYTLIVPIWMWRSVFNVITKKKNTWR